MSNKIVNADKTMSGERGEWSSSGGSKPSLTASWSALESFSYEVGSLWCSSRIPILQEPPSSLTFCRDYVSRSRPCIIRNGIVTDQNQPLHLTLDGLTQLMKEKDSGDHQITVDVTPDGHGDRVRTVVDAQAQSKSDLRGTKMFVKPHEQAMSIGKFQEGLRARKKLRLSLTEDSDLPLDENGLPILDLKSENGATAAELPSLDVDTASIERNDSSDNSVYYYSRQNDCLRTEFSSVQDVVPPTIEWAENAFGTGPPDAMNLWIGDESAVSSMHKDHYENIFFVASGEKVFTICPPADAPFLYEHCSFDSGIFARSDGGTGTWSVQPDAAAGQEASTPQVRWIEPDVEALLDHDSSASCALLRRFPLLQHAHPIQITVRAGEMLYLPALWFHRVTQTCETVGINYWYDMRFDSPHWCYFHLLQQLRETKDPSLLISQTRNGQTLSETCINRIENIDGCKHESKAATETAEKAEHEIHDEIVAGGDDEPIELPVLKYGYRETKLTWEEMVHIIKVENNILRLTRSVEQQTEYERSKRRLKIEWHSIYDHILHSKFGFAREKVSQSHNRGIEEKKEQRYVWKSFPPLSTCTESKTALVLNDFPYFVEDGILHYILWKIVDDITDHDVDKARCELQAMLGTEEIIHWENPPEVRSLPSINHIHFLCRKKTTMTTRS